MTITPSVNPAVTPTISKNKMSLTKRVLVGMGLGILVGFVIRSLFADVAFVQDYIVNGVF